MIGAIGMFLMGMVSGGMLPQPLQNSLNQQLYNLFPNNLPDMLTLTELRKRGDIDDKSYYGVMRLLGYDAKAADYYLSSADRLLQVNEIISLSHRGYLDRDMALSNLKRLGIKEGDAILLLDGSRSYLPLDIYNELWKRGKITDEQLKDYMNKLGLQDFEVNNLMEFNRKIYDMGTLITMRFREIISEDDYYKGMAELGFNEDMAKKIFEISYHYPSPEDFIRFAVRDVFNPDRVKKYKLDIEFPEAIVKYANKAGISEDVLKWYWESHWELPSPEMVMRMVNILQPDVLNTKLPDGSRYGDKYKRFGLNPDEIITTYDDMSEFLAMADISPYWRDRLKALTFPPLSRVDLRRIFQLGLISEEELKARLLELGYSVYDAELMIKFYKAYKNKEEKDLTKSEILNLYEIDAISDNDAINFLGKLGYEESEAKYILSLATYKKVKRSKEEYIKILIDLYGNGTIDFNTLNSQLGKLDIGANEMEYWKEKAEHEKIKHQKIPNHKELISMYKEGVINDSEFKEYMSRNGFNDYWINKYMNMIKGKGV